MATTMTQMATIRATMMSTVLGLTPMDSHTTNRVIATMPTVVLSNSNMRQVSQLSKKNLACRVSMAEAE